MAAVQPPPPPLSRAQIEAAITALSAAEWRRLEFVGNGLAAGVTGWTGEDLLQEALTKFLEGARTWPAGLPSVHVIGMVMMSIANNERASNAASPVDENEHVNSVEGHADEEDGGGQGVVGVSVTTPEDVVAARQEMAAVYAAVAGDPGLEKLVKLWAEGIRGEEARDEMGWTSQKYEAERKRLTRRLAHVNRGDKQ
jgi:hypothetical protein